MRIGSRRGLLSHRAGTFRDARGDVLETDAPARVPREMFFYRTERAYRVAVRRLLNGGEQRVCDTAHRGDDHDARPPLCRYNMCDTRESLRVLNRRAAEFHNRWMI